MFIKYPTAKIVTSIDKFLPPRDKVNSQIESWSIGPTEFGGGTTKRIDMRIWRCFIDNNMLKIQSEDGEITEEIKPLDKESITNLDFTFDQTCNPVIVYTKNSKSFIYFFDTTITTYKEVALNDDIFDIKISIDGTNFNDTHRTDIILAYTNKNGDLCYRIQREGLYLTEHILMNNNSAKRKYLWKIGRLKDDKSFGFQWQ